MGSLYRYYKRLKADASNPEAKPSIALKIVLPLIGLLALIWFLVRVIPKPSRATYPCQRVAFPLASSFIIWLTGVMGSAALIKKAQRYHHQVFTAAICIAASVLCVWLTLSAAFDRPALAEVPLPNTPIGIAKGIFPGRVVWVHDPSATDWNGPAAGDGYSWQSENTLQKYVDAMVRKAVCGLTGCEGNVQAWDALFRYFNRCQGKQDKGYTPGEKITIKVNLTTCNLTVGAVNPSTYQKISHLDSSDTNPQLILSVLRQLVYTAGVEPNCIAVGDTLARFPNQWRDILFSEFPEVIYFDKIGGSGRTQSTPSAVVQHWSHGLDPESFLTDYIPVFYAEAEYLINIAVLKSHAAGITLCAKNNYGSYNRTPDSIGYYNLHNSLAGFNTAAGQYRALVDIMGHPHMGGKTLLYILDALYAGQNWQGNPVRFEMDPFNHDWPSSILVSQDPLAIDSVGLDILWNEWPAAVQKGGVEDYLSEAALADNPPSGTFYDPANNGMGIQSLGVYERWNNPTDRQYSRNLGIGEGIELDYIKLNHNAGDLNSDDYVGVEDLMQLSEQWLWHGNPGAILEDINQDGYVNLNDFENIAGKWGFSY